MIAVYLKQHQSILHCEKLYDHQKTREEDQIQHIQTLEDAVMEAKDREKWQAIVQDPSLISE